MTEIILHSERLDRVLAKACTLSTALPWETLTEKAAYRAAERAVERKVEYPPYLRAPMPQLYTRTPQKRSHTWTPRQRRWFFANLREGNIQLHAGPYPSKFKAFKHQFGFFSRLTRGEIVLPYNRSGALGNSLTYRLHVQFPRAGFVMGSNRDYAPKVIGDETQQAPYHRGHWTPLAEQVRDNIAPISDAFADGLLLALRDFLAQ